MLAGLLLAAVCLEMPSFDLEGPTCPPDRLEVPCACSEAVLWDPPADGGAPAWYEFRRRTVSTGSIVALGTRPEPIWYVAWDQSFPRAGVRYDYEARACNAAGCGPWGDPVRYVGADYACYDGGREVACYVGDEVISR